MSTQIDNLDDILAFLNQHTDFEKQQGGRTRDEFDLIRMTELSNALARPDLSYFNAHIAGTKGKGSVAQFLGSMLQSQGLKVGLYTSPHLERLTQRISINGEEISEPKMVKAFRQIVKVLEAEAGGGDDVTFFELLTLAGMLVFRDEGVDVAVFEVGLGGRLDSTNVISPTVSVITEIGRDHVAQLGGSIVEIAREKAGIIKPGIPVVCGATHKDAQRVVTLTARDHEAPLLMLGRDFNVRNLQRDGFNLTFSADVKGHRYEKIELNRPGRYMADNAAMALCALEVLAAEPDLLIEEKLDRERLVDAITRTELPARFEKFGNVILDSAHNVISVKAALSTARTVTDGHLGLVFGIAQDKDVEDCIKMLAEKADSAVFTGYYNPRESHPEDLLRLYEKFGGKNGSTTEHPEAALEEALDNAQDGTVLILGSTYLAGQLRPALA